MSQPIARLLRRESADLLTVLHSADLVVGNFEGSIIDHRTFDGHPAAQSGFGWLTSPPEVADDLVELGFDLLSRANNHSTDWGHQGLASTDDHLNNAGLRLAGTGRNLSAARAPGYHDGERARTSLVSFTTTFEGDTPATDALGLGNGRPGASTLRLTPIAKVSPTQLQALREIRDAQPPASRPDVLLQIDDMLGVVTLFGQHYAAHAPGVDEPVMLDYKVDPDDLAGILLNVRQAKQTSDFTVVASHTHEPDNWTTTTPAFLRNLATQSFEHGADVFVAHGPHQLRGIEILGSHVAFYSLGNFCFMDNAQAVVVREEWERRLWHLAPGRERLHPEKTTPAEFLEWMRVAGVFGEDVWFESVIPVIAYDADGAINHITLHPVELRAHGRDAERGIPRLASPETGADILTRLSALSEPYGTGIDIDHAAGTGTIKGR